MMFENIDKSKIPFEKYIELKTKTLTKSYTERFKWIDRFLYWFSWFGNAVSIFLAFFFIQALFFSSFMEVKDSIIITFGIIIFLTMFELLKRYIFGMFSLELIKNKFKMFNKNMVTFILGVMTIVSGSFYFTLSGAMKFVDNRQVFKTQTEVNMTTKVDSINTFYFNQYIKPLMDDNKTLTEQNTDYSRQTTYKSKYTNLIEANNKKIETNQRLISQYEKRRDDEVSSMKNDQTTKLNNSLDENKSNIIAFIILSTLIEVVIMLGIYYDKYYKYKLIKEYEETVVDTPEFKKWHKFNFLLGLVYSKTKEIGEHIPSVNGLIELSEVNGSKVDKQTIDRFIKVLYYLEIVKLEGNRRVLNMREEEGVKKLRNYFNII